MARSVFKSFLRSSQKSETVENKNFWCKEAAQCIMLHLEGYFGKHDYLTRISRSTPLVREIKTEQKSVCANYESHFITRIHVCSCAEGKVFGCANLRRAKLRRLRSDLLKSKIWKSKISSFVIKMP